MKSNNTLAFDSQETQEEDSQPSPPCLRAGAGQGKERDAEVAAEKVVVERSQRKRLRKVGEEGSAGDQRDNQSPNEDGLNEEGEGDGLQAPNDLDLPFTPRRSKRQKSLFSFSQDAEEQEEEGGTGTEQGKEREGKEKAAYQKAVKIRIQELERKTFLSPAEKLQLSRLTKIFEEGTPRKGKHSKGSPSSRDLNQQEDAGLQSNEEQDRGEKCYAYYQQVTIEKNELEVKGPLNAKEIELLSSLKNVLEEARKKGHVLPPDNYTRVDLQRDLEASKTAAYVPPEDNLHGQKQGRGHPSSQVPPFQDSRSQRPSTAQAQQSPPSRRSAGRSGADRVAAPVLRTEAPGAASRLTSEERVNYRALQKRVESLSRELRLVKQDRTEKEALITKLQKQIAALQRKHEVREVLSPKKIEAARKFVLKRILLGDTWHANLYPDEDTVMYCMLARLDLTDKEHIQTFKNLDAPPLPTKPKPSQDAIEAWKGAMAKHLEDFVWLHGPKERGRRRLNGDAFLSAAVQAMIGEGASVDEEHILQVRPQILGLFIVAGKKALKAEKFDSINVGQDREEVAKIASESEDVFQEGKLSPRIQLLLPPPKPKRPRLSDYSFEQEGPFDPVGDEMRFDEPDLEAENHTPDEDGLEE